MNSTLDVALPETEINNSWYEGNRYDELCCIGIQLTDVVSSQGVSPFRLCFNSLSFTLWLRERAHFTVISAEMTRASRVRSPFGMVPWQDVWLLLRLRERAHFTIISADSARFGARPSLRIDSLRVRSGSSTVSWDLVRLVFFLWSDMCFVFMFSGALCSLIDKVFYGGSLDFIGIGDLFVADIKDIYINLGILFFIALMFKSGVLTSEDTSSFKEDMQSIKRFFNFIKSDIQNIFKKKKDI